VRTIQPVEILAPTKAGGLCLRRVTVACRCRRRPDRDGGTPRRQHPALRDTLQHYVRSFGSSRRPMRASVSSVPLHGNNDALHEEARIDVPFANGFYPVQAVHNQRHPWNGLPH